MDAEENSSTYTDEKLPWAHSKFEMLRDHLRQKPPGMYAELRAKVEFVISHPLWKTSSNIHPDLRHPINFAVLVCDDFVAFDTQAAEDEGLREYTNFGIAALALAIIWVNPGGLNDAPVNHQQAYENAFEMGSALLQEWKKLHRVKLMKLPQLSANLSSIV